MICLILFIYFYWMASSQEKMYDNMGEMTTEDWAAYMRAVQGKKVR